MCIGIFMNTDEKIKYLEQYIAAMKKHQDALAEQIDALLQMHDLGLDMVFNSIESSGSWEQFKSKMAAMRLEMNSDTEQ